MIFIAALLTIISGKRTALISIILCGFLPPLLEKDDKRGKKKTGTMVLLMIVCIMLVYVSEYLSKSININIIERMQSLQEDGGSGRTTTYALVWEAFKSSNIVKQVIGHGYNAVYLDKISISSAHNDFLEVLYDYGAIGLLFYVLLLFNFIFEAVKLRKAQCESFAAVTASILIYITLSCVSHLIIYPTYNVFLLFIISMGFSEYERNQKNSVGGEATK
ncbi:MAG: O-antigen ligase family protein [Gemmiger formicilis]|nr:O-antigen ligase family protein [Gemmiger formicilis]MCC2192039.1 O-antigen ligase family protein [Gemmiger formicilis]